MVREVFHLARENSPCIVFIDEVDAIATKRFDAQTGADREVQRILLELLNQMDGFDQTTNIKVIMATNRADTLDPALLPPGRLDRKIEFPVPDRRQKRMVFQAATAKMNLSDELDLEDYVNRSEKVSSADISSICSEAGLQAGTGLRLRRAGILRNHSSPVDFITDLVRPNRNVLEHSSNPIQSNPSLLCICTRIPQTAIGATAVIVATNVVYGSHSIEARTMFVPPPPQKCALNLTSILYSNNFDRIGIRKTAETICDYSSETSCAFN